MTTRSGKSFMSEHRPACTRTPAVARPPAFKRAEKNVLGGGGGAQRSRPVTDRHHYVKINPPLLFRNLQ